MAQPNSPDALYREVLPSRPARNLILKLIAAIIVGIVLSTAAFLILGNHEKIAKQLAVVEYTTIHCRSGETTSYTLPDGTKVWLNTNSTLRYPKQFGTDSRRIEFDGEAYFDVAKDELRPFIVLTDSSETKVLGTLFNVDAYKRSGILKITLLEGSILVGKYTIGSPERTVPVIKILKGLERTGGFKFYPKKNSFARGETVMILRNE